MQGQGQGQDEVSKVVGADEEMVSSLLQVLPFSMTQICTLILIVLLHLDNLDTISLNDWGPWHPTPCCATQWSPPPVLVTPRPSCVSAVTELGFEPRASSCWTAGLE